MLGTLLNIATVLIGGAIGLLFGARVPDRMRQTVIAGLGLFTSAIGVQMFLKTENAIIVLGSLLLGGLLGEWWRIEDRLRDLGAFLERRFTPRPSAGAPAVGDLAGGDPAGGDSATADLAAAAHPGSNRFVRGFLTASLVFCVGPMTILGSIQDGLTGDYQLLAIKSVLDGFASLAFASSLGVGVLFSTLIILVYQGGLSLLAAQVQTLVTAPMMNEMTAAGGILLLGIGLSSLLEIKPIRVGNFLPALLIAPLIVALLAAVGI